MQKLFLEDSNLRQWKYIICNLFQASVVSNWAEIVMEHVFVFSEKNYLFNLFFQRVTGKFVLEVGLLRTLVQLVLVLSLITNMSLMGWECMESFQDHIEV